MHDYDRTVTAASGPKNPNVSALNRLMGRGKAIIAKYLSDKTGMKFDPSTFVKEWYNTVDYRWFAYRDENRGTQCSVEIHVAWEDRAGSYSVRTTANKGQRGVGFHRVEGLSLEDFKSPSKYIPQSVLDDLMKAMGGDYSKEMGEIKEAASELVEMARENLKAAEMIAALAKDDPLANEDIITRRKYDLKDCGYTVNRILDSIQIIKKGE